jgi:hypothetical protein
MGDTTLRKSKEKQPFIDFWLKYMTSEVGLLEEDAPKYRFVHSEGDPSKYSSPALQTCANMKATLEEAQAGLRDVSISGAGDYLQTSRAGSVHQSHAPSNRTSPTPSVTHEESPRSQRPTQSRKSKSSIKTTTTARQRQEIIALRQQEDELDRQNAADVEIKKKEAVMKQRQHDRDREHEESRRLEQEAARLLDEDARMREEEDSRRREQESRQRADDARMREEDDSRRREQESRQRADDARRRDEKDDFQRRENERIRKRRRSPTRSPKHDDNVRDLITSCIN